MEILQIHPGALNRDFVHCGGPGGPFSLSKFPLVFLQEIDLNESINRVLER